MERTSHARGMHERGGGGVCLPVRFLPRLRSETRTLPLQTHRHRPRVQRKCPQINRDYHGQQQSSPATLTGPPGPVLQQQRCGGAREPPPWSPGAWSLELCTPSFPRRTSTFRNRFKGATAERVQMWGRTESPQTQSQRFDQMIWLNLQTSRLKCAKLTIKRTWNQLKPAEKQCFCLPQI